MTARILGKIRVPLGWSRKVPALIFGVKSDHAALVIQVTAFLQDIYYTYKRDASRNASGRGSMNFQEISRKTHYHIRWTRKAKLDWQPFRTSAEAEERAKELALRGEGYAIEEHGEACSQCGSMMKSVGA